MFRRAAIHAALGSARSFYSTLGKWHKRKEKAIAKGKKFTERPPVPPRTWNKSATLYAGQWKERAGSSILLKVWTGSVWSWIKVRITGREIPDGVEMASPSLIRRGNQWWLHTPIEKQFKSSEVEGTEVEVRYDPFNIGIAYAYVKNTWVRCVSLYHTFLQGHSEKELMLASKEIRRQNP